MPGIAIISPPVVHLVPVLRHNFAVGNLLDRGRVVEQQIIESVSRPVLLFVGLDQGHELLFLLQGHGVEKGLKVFGRYRVPVGRGVVVGRGPAALGIVKGFKRLEERRFRLGQCPILLLIRSVANDIRGHNE